MSTPVKREGDVEEIRRRARRPRSKRSLAVIPPEPIAREAPPMTPEVSEDMRRQPELESELPPKPLPRLPQGLGGPNIDWHSVLMPAQAPRAPQVAPAGVYNDVNRQPPPAPPVATRQEFEGDTAIKALRHRLSLDPEFVPAPPMRASRSVMPTLGRLALVVVLAAFITCGVTLLSLPDTRPAIFNQDPGAAFAALLANLPTGVPAPPQPTPRLIVEGRQTFANEALELGVSLNGAVGSEFALVTGLASGTQFSVGGPFGANGWRIPAQDLGKAVAIAPRDFVGVMDTSIDLRLRNDRLVDSKVMRLEWIPKQVEVRGPSLQQDRDRAKSAFRPMDGAEVAMLVKRGQDYLRVGDIVSARLVLRRAVAARDAQAAFTLGASFDPAVLAELGVLGFAPDAAQARAWYQRAAEFGSTEASRRIERLAKLTN